MTSSEMAKRMDLAQERMISSTAGDETRNHPERLKALTG